MMYIIRGLPGTGKTTLGETLCPGRCYAADDYFYQDGEYRFDPSLLGEAHASCQARVRAALEGGKDVAVANTFTQEWEWQPYLEMAKEIGVRVSMISLYDQGLSLAELEKRNVHGVPLAALEAMKNRYQH